LTKIILLIFELIGVVAFAMSGVLTGLKKDMDIFGISTLGLITAVGGGVIRDLVLGNTPPETFKNPIYGIVALIISVSILFPKIRRLLKAKQHVFDYFLLIMDSLGLSVFTVMGIKTATAISEDFNVYLLLFVALITGTGGGILRDVLAGDRPAIFVKHFYATASLIGAIVCVVLWNIIGDVYSMLIGAVVVFVLRICAAHFHWNLPAPKD